VYPATWHVHLETLINYVNNLCHILNVLLDYCTIRCGYGSFEQFGKPGCINPDVQRQTIEALLASADVPSSRFLRPEFIRLAPPLHTSDDEVCIQY